MALHVDQISKWSLLGFTLLLALSFVGVVNNRAFAGEPRTPTEDDEILERLKPSQNNNSDKLKIMRDQLRRTPNNIKLAEELVRSYIEIARVNTDVRYYGYAQAVLAPWWGKERPPTEVLLLRATLYQQKHNYQKALEDLKQLINRQPNNIQAWLTLATIQQVLGDYDAMRSSCTGIARLRLLWLSTLCHSQALALTGAAERAFTLQRSVQLQLDASEPDLKQWVLGIQAETALRLGRQKQSEELFKRALVIGPRNAYLLRVYSDFLLSENRGDEVISLLKEEEQDTALLLRLTIAAKKTKRQKLLRNYRNLLLSRFKAASLRGSKLHERDEALYILESKGNMNKGLNLARNNWNIQKEPDDALILLRFGIAVGSDKDVQTIREWMTKTQLQDPRIQARLEKRDRNDI